MKGILICGGTGIRLQPLTDVTNKSLLPVYDRPLIHEPLHVLLNAGIREIAVVTGTEHIGQIAEHLGSGSKFGCEFTYKVQEEAQGIAQALGLAEDFANDESICAILGDNIYLDDISPMIRDFQDGGHVFVKEVSDPERFGVVTLDDNTVISIEEKPKKPKSNLVATGCYLYDNRCFDIIKHLKPSWRGELEITDVSHWYMEKNELTATVLQDEWIDAGTFESLYKASTLLRKRDKRLMYNTNPLISKKSWTPSSSQTKKVTVSAKKK